MRWLQCSATAFQSPPSARMGHVTIVVDARGSWGEEFMIVHGGLSEEKYALDDLTVLQATSAAWFHPEVPNTVRPPSRAFHCGAAIGRKVYIFGGHVWVKEMREASSMQTWTYSQPYPLPFERGLDCPDRSPVMR